MKETSKTYQRLGRIVGIEADLKSKRGVIARRAAQRLEELECVESVRTMKRICL